MTKSGIYLLTKEHTQIVKKCYLAQYVNVQHQMLPNTNTLKNFNLQLKLERLYLITHYN